MIRVGQTVTEEELGKIYTFIIGKINEINEDNIEGMNTGNFLGTDSSRTFEPLSATGEQFTGYIGGSGSWLTVIRNDANQAINR